MKEDIKTALKGKTADQVISEANILKAEKEAIIKLERYADFKLIPAQYDQHKCHQ